MKQKPEHAAPGSGRMEIQDMKAVFWTIFAAMAVTYAVMLIWTLPTISAEAAGLAPFDMRPLGYSFDEAKAFLSALSADGRDLYLHTQLWLDLFYPALLAASLIFATVLLTVPGLLRWLLILPAILGMVFDYLENFSVGRMLEAGPDTLTEALAGEASRWTILKSGFTTISMVAVIVLLVVWFVTRQRRA
jgi:hypothetical protein